MCLAVVLIAVAMALPWTPVSFLLGTLLCMIFLNKMVVLPAVTSLATEFGKEYLLYKARMRTWST